MRTNQGVCLCIAVILCLQTGPARAQGVAAITRPSEDVTLSFVQPGRIAKVLVKEGDEVKVGQLLVQQDDAAERVQLAQLRAEAENTVRITTREAQLQQKRVERDKLEDAFKKKAVSKWDVEQARINVVIAEANLALEKLNHEQAKLKYDEKRIQVERMCLASPIVGKVEEVSLKAGESADATAERKKIIRVVKVDPLWIEVPVPLAQTRRLRKDGPANVRFPDTTGRPTTGKIIHIAGVADAASDTLTVRVEVPNPTGRPAGEHVNVGFPVAR